jgi:nucleoside-diphosphate-sugar epimerase
MNILLTGIAGFIGARTAELMAEQGHTVVGVDNLNDYYDLRVKEYRLSRLDKYENITFHPIDIEDKESLEALFKVHQFDAVVNLAARAGVRASIVDPYVYLSTNTLGSLNLLDLMRENEVQKYVMASTSSLYAGVPMPFLETADVRQPLSPYASSKLGAETMAYSYHHLHGIEVSVLRYFTVYGPAGRPDMSPFRFTEWVNRGEKIQLFGDGEQTRDFTYIDDIALGTIAATEKCSGYEIYNIGGGNEPISINTMIAEIEKHTGKKAQIDYLPQNNADMQDTAANINKATSLLEWSPKVHPVDGLQRTVEWHEANQKWLKNVSLEL